MVSTVPIPNDGRKTGNGYKPVKDTGKLESVVKIKSLLRAGLTQQKIADQFHISCSHVSYINTGRSRAVC